MQVRRSAEADRLHHVFALDRDYSAVAAVRCALLLSLQMNSVMRFSLWSETNRLWIHHLGPEH